MQKLMQKALRYVLCFMVGKGGIDFWIVSFLLSAERRKVVVGGNKQQKTPVRNDQQPLANFLVAL